MKKIALVLLAVIAAAAAVAPPAPAGRGPWAATAVGVAQHDFHLTAYRRTVRPGKVKFNITNLGQDTHNLVIAGPRGFRVEGPDVASGERASLPVTLRRQGTYQLLCTRANHLSLGMRTKLVVRP